MKRPSLLTFILAGLLLSACTEVPTTPGLERTLSSLKPGAAVSPAGSSVQLSAMANAISTSSADPATDTDSDGDNQGATSSALNAAVSVVSVNGSGTLQASGDISATWVGTSTGQVIWNVAWEASDLPPSSGSLVAVSAIGPGDGWTYTFTADVDGDFVLDFDITAGGSNMFGLNPFNFLWLPPGAPLPTQSVMTQGTSGMLTMTVSAGAQYTARITNNSGVVSNGTALSNRTATMTGTFDWRIVPLLLTVSIDIKPGSEANCFNNDGHGVIPVAILGSAELDVTAIDPSTVQLESLAVRAVGRNSMLQAHVEDVNADGFPDLVVQIEDADGAFTDGEGTATLTGALFDGTPIQGTDAICVVP